MHGNKWTYISMLIPGRSENSIKNRWHNRKTQQRRTMRREFARLNAASSQVATTQIATTNTRGSQQLRTVKVEDIKEDVAGRNPCNGEVEDTGTEQGANGACTVKVEDVDRDIDEV